MRDRGIPRRTIWVLGVLLTSALLALLWSPLSGALSQRRLTAQQVVAAFDAAGLEASDVRPMSLTDLGAAPNLAEEALLFPIWSLKGCFCAEEPRGYVMTFADAADLDAVKQYYDDLGTESVVFHRWTFARRNVLVAIPGAVTAEDAEAYRQVLERL